MKLKFNKIFSLILVICFSFSLVACGNKPTEDKKSSENNSVQGTTSAQNNDSDKKQGEEQKDDASKEEEKKTETQYKLYFVDANAEYLVPENRTIENATPKSVIEELLKGPKEEGLYASLNKEINVKDVTVKDKIATIDFDESILGRVTGTTGETMAMYSMANTLILNKSLDIEKIQFTLNGQHMDSLGEHYILEKPVEANETLIKK